MDRDVAVDVNRPPAQPPDAAQVLELVVAMTGRVLGIGRREVDPDARFAEDLRADSLDLLEIVEGVERALRDRGVVVDLPDGELVALRTVREAAERIAADAGRAA